MKSHTPECAKIEQFAATLTPAKTYHLCVQFPMPVDPIHMPCRVAS